MVQKALFWEEVDIEQEIPPLKKIASSQMLAKWAAASGDFNPLHYEFPFAESQGVGRPIVHGQLKRSWLIQLLTDWIWPEGEIRKFSCQFRAMDYPVLMQSISEPANDSPTHYCKGKVVNKYIERGQGFITCDVWVENHQGEVTTPGKAELKLPFKDEKNREL